MLAGHTNDVSRAFRNRGMLQENWLLVTATLLIGSIWLALYLWENIQLRRKANADTPQGLFYDLCKTHRLNRTDITYLLKAAQAHYREQPAMVFVDPGVLNAYIKEVSSDAKYYELLADKLFKQ